MRRYDQGDKKAWVPHHPPLFRTCAHARLVKDAKCGGTLDPQQVDLVVQIGRGTTTEGGGGYVALPHLRGSATTDGKTRATTDEGTFFCVEIFSEGRDPLAC